MSKKEIEIKIIKYLHRASRLKPTKLKLEKIHELLEILWALPIHETGVSNNSSQDPDELSLDLVNQYIELCHIHAIKFQMDALFAGVTHELSEREKHSEQLDQEQFDRLLQKLYAVLAIDVDHSEAQGLIGQLTGEYPEYAEHSSLTHVYIDLIPYQQPELTIELECPLTNITDDEQLRSLYKTYQIDVNEGEQNAASSLCRLRFSLQQFSTFATFHEELHTNPNYHIFVNNQSIEEKAFTIWFHCYTRYLKAKNPQYCYGASPLTLNFFGCHKVFMPDVMKYLEHCWFHYGTLDQESGLFLVAKHQIADQIRLHLDGCGFCPALSQEKFDVGLGLIPSSINPEYDTRWNYLYDNGSKIGVVPAGHDFAIALHPLETETFETATLIGVSSTPYIDKVLQYLVSYDLDDLHKICYKGISQCLNCGLPYKLHTMTCSRCKTEFGKYALKEGVEKIIKDLTYRKPIEFPSPKGKSSSASRPEHASGERKKDMVSFDQLWSDPQIQKLLSTEPESESAPQQKSQTTPTIAPDEKHDEPAPIHQEESLTEPEALPQPPVSQPAQPISSGRFDLHGKLRSLISKKYRERKAIEHAFSGPQDFTGSSGTDQNIPQETAAFSKTLVEPSTLEERSQASGSSAPPVPPPQKVDTELLNAVKKLKPRQKSELSKRGVVRVIYHATIDKEICPLCNYLDGMVMDPDASATDIFSPPLYSGCTCSREYVLKTEKPSNWPEVTFQFPPKELLEYLEKPQS